MKSGFTAIIGRPNVGKSTLLNQILEQKIVIATNKAQTTRKRIKGIYTTSESQIVFVDTPGIHKPLNKLGEFLLDEAKVSVPDADVVLFLVDVSTPSGKGDKWIVENVLSNVSSPVIMVLNKTDKASPKKIDENILSYKELFPNAVETIRISAKTGKNKSKLVDSIVKYLPEGEMLYPEDIVTEENMRSIVEEIVREKILINTQDEIPHSVAVKVDEYKEDVDIDRIRATIFCEQKSQKGILIGKNGSLLKIIGTQARQDLEKIVEKKVFLGLQVKIEKDWRKKDKVLKSFGYVSEEQNR
jgi:GTP-binding protein Era